MQALTPPFALQQKRVRPELRESRINEDRINERRLYVQTTDLGRALQLRMREDQAGSSVLSLLSCNISFQEIKQTKLLLAFTGLDLTSMLHQNHQIRAAN
jgi:hypothetical protein